MEMIVEFNEAKEYLEAIKHDLNQEIGEWRSLTASVVSQADKVEGEIAEFTRVQQTNVQRLSDVAARFKELEAVAIDKGAISTQLAQQMSTWLNLFSAAVTGVQQGLETLVPDFTMHEQPVDDAIEHLRGQFEEKSAALVAALVDRLGEAQARIEENLTAAVQVLATSVEEMSDGLAEALNDAHESLKELWEDTSENISANESAIASKGDDLKELLTAAVSGAVDKVTGQFGSVSEAVDELLSELRRTLDNVERTLELVGEVTEGTSVGMKGASTSLDAVRQIISSVA
jgi:hypothetical protein